MRKPASRVPLGPRIKLAHSLLLLLSAAIILGILSACTVVEKKNAAASRPIPNPANTGSTGASATNSTTQPARISTTSPVVQNPVLTTSPLASGNLSSIITPTLPASPLPQLPVSPSPRLPVSPSPQLLSTPAPRLPSTLIFARPISATANDQIDTTYRFGSTQGKKRDPHHGVEFLNPSGTPVLAAADGMVVVAGDDKKTLYSPYFNFYGNLIVIRHDLPPDTFQNAPAFRTPVYTLYAHLSEILVKPGDKVNQGQEIGRVGMTGGATGSHLHFEVRLGENTYAASRNPELWLQPTLGETGQPKGALAGRVIDAQGKPIAVKGVVIQHLPDGPKSRSDWEIYLDSYAEKALLGQPPWQESFAAGELPAGWYRINFPYAGMQRLDVQVFPGLVTEAVFNIQ